MNLSALEYLVSPLTHHRLQFDPVEGKLIGCYQADSFPVIEGIPLLLPVGDIPDYEHNVLEILFGERTAQVLARLSPADPDRTGELRILIQKDLGARGVKEAFERYAKLPSGQRQVWFVKFPSSEENIEVPVISKEQLERGRKHVSLDSAKRKAEQLATMEHGWAVHLSAYAGRILQSCSSSIILELGTGAGLGTNSLLRYGLNEAQLFTLDIDFTCTKIAEGLANWYEVEDRVNPVVANFWLLPFKENSIDVVCSHYGVDESREISRMISEVTRVLTNGGRFVSVSRKDPTLRFSMLDHLGFGREDFRQMASAVGIYSGPDDLIQFAEDNSLLLESEERISPPGSHERVIFVFKKDKS